jgi:hypothetical protein
VVAHQVRGPRVTGVYTRQDHVHSPLFSNKNTL